MQSVLLATYITCTTLLQNINDISPINMVSYTTGLYNLYSPKTHKKFLVPQQICYALRHWFSNFRVERTVRGVCYCFMKQQWVGLKEEEAVSWKSSLWFDLLAGIFKWRGNFHICDNVDVEFTMIVIVRFSCSWHLKVLPSSRSLLIQCILCCLYFWEFYWLKVRISKQMHTLVWLLMGSKLRFGYRNFFSEPLHFEDNALSVMTWVTEYFEHSN